MVEFLATLIPHVREQIERRRRDLPLAALRERPLFHVPQRSLTRAVNGAGRRIIAEVKRASPSKGIIRADFDPIAIAREYSSQGASAISVLTEEHFFEGSLDYLEQIKAAVEQPVLRKDFIIDPYQLCEAKSYGADAVLLIAALLDPGLLRDLALQATELSLDVLVEVHNESELEAALESGASLLGINNRDLRTFEVNLATTQSLAPLIPPGVPAVCESGIDSVEQIRRVEQWGIHIFLIGESLMRAPQPGKRLRELLQQD
jgi:indole-3-glycerol phosphate synthase